MGGTRCWTCKRFRMRSIRQPFIAENGQAMRKHRSKVFLVLFDFVFLALPRHSPQAVSALGTLLGCSQREQYPQAKAARTPKVAIYLFRFWRNRINRLARGTNTVRRATAHRA